MLHAIGAEFPNQNAVVLAGLAAIESGETDGYRRFPTRLRGRCTRDEQFATMLDPNEQTKRFVIRQYASAHPLSDISLDQRRQEQARECDR